MQKKMVETHNYYYTTQNFLQRMKNTIIIEKKYSDVSNPSNFSDMMFKRFTQDILPSSTQELQKW